MFVEPEGWSTIECYVNGFSTSLPEDIQYLALSKVKGFENVKFFRPGYAVEYDYFPPTQLKLSLETKIVNGLFFAGQINGTTGYEEAGAQGLMAGINANRLINNKKPVVLSRAEAYIGVLIDDLITKGTDEPYRMFTSRAEYRTLLRQDNADLRLTPLANKIGLANKQRMGLVNKKKIQTKSLIDFYKKTSVKPDEINSILVNKKTPIIKQSEKLFKIYSRPNILFKEMSLINKVKVFIEKNSIEENAIEQAEVSIKYSGYIKKELNNVKKLKKLERLAIPNAFNYDILPSLSSEAKEKLNRVRPKSISQASRISGIKPSDLSVILVELGR